MPPVELLESPEGLFLPAPEAEKFLREMFVHMEGSPFYDETHAHLNCAEIGVLWTNNELKIEGSRKAAVAFMPRSKGLSKLDKDVWAYLFRSWFRTVPDFAIIFDAAIAARASDREFLLTGSHELTHCGQETKMGVPQFHQNRLPKFAMRAHDHELFTSDFRFGARTVLGKDAVDAVLRSELDGPEISDEYIRRMCGTCSPV
jgi:hypothetical protein